jgi:hypothetical protein
MANPREELPRFLCIKVDARKANAMAPWICPGAILLIDRHYNSLRSYRRKHSNVYAVYNAGSVLIRYIEPSFSATPLSAKPAISADHNWQWERWRFGGRSDHWPHLLCQPWPHRKRGLQKEDGRGSAETVGGCEEGEGGVVIRASAPLGQQTLPLSLLPLTWGRESSTKSSSRSCEGCSARSH